MEKSALILAGGEGSRLRPITDSTPAALLKICRRPLIDYTLEILRKYGYESICVSADRRSDLIAEHLADNPDTDIIFSPVPCGSCLPIVHAAKSCKNFLTVIFGNTLFDCDLSAAEKFHAATGADITIVTHVTDKPSQHSIAAVDENNRITAIIPDMAHESCQSDLALTGIFILDKSIAEAAENCTDLLTDFLPKIVECGKVMNFTLNGKFHPINTPNDYFFASKTVSANLDPTDRIAASAQLAAGVKISSDTIIGENVTICRGAELNSAIISDSAYIGERVKASGFIGKGAKLLSGATVEEGAIVGDNSIIGEQAIVQSGVKIRSGARLEAYSCAKSDTGGVAVPMRITDDGICGETGSIITPQTAALIGSSITALSSKIGNAKIGVSFREGNSAECLAHALCTGIAASGGEAWLFGASSEPALCYCTEKAGLSACCYIDSGVTTKIRLFSGDGLPLSRRQEKLVEQGLRGNYSTASFNSFGKIKDVSSMIAIYENELENTAPKSLSEIRAVLNTSGKAVSETCEKILYKINNKNGSPIVFHISSNGRGISAYTEETGYVFEDKLIMLCCKTLFEQDKDVSVPHNFTATL